MKTVTDIVKELRGVWPSTIEYGFLRDYISPAVWAVTTSRPKEYNCTRKEFEAEAKRLGYRRELNPPTSSATYSQAREFAEESGTCSDGKPCTDGVACNACPNRNPVDNPDEVAFKHSKYHVKIKGAWIDVYDILHAYQVTNPGDQHAIKKMLMPGKRGHKDAEKDRAEAIQSLQRAIELESTNG